MRSTVLMGFVLAGLCVPCAATRDEGYGFPLITPAEFDPECIEECLRENQRVSVGFEELQRRCRDDCEVIRALRLVQSRDAEEYAEGISILCDSDDRRAVGPLIAALRWDLEVRTGQWARIIPALGALRDSSAVPILIETLKIPDDDWLGREMSARALGEIGDASAIPALSAAAWRGDTRDDAVVALAEIYDIRVVPVLVSALDSGEEPETREAAISGLSRLGSMAVPELVEALGEHSSEHPETQRRVWICRLLGESGDLVAMEELTAHRSDPDTAVARCAAGFAEE
jgi:HEAT repeat protein